MRLLSLATKPIAILQWNTNGGLSFPFKTKLFRNVVEICIGDYYTTGEAHKIANKEQIGGRITKYQFESMKPDYILCKTTVEKRPGLLTRPKGRAEYREKAPPPMKLKMKFGVTRCTYSLCAKNGKRTV